MIVPKPPPAEHIVLNDVSWEAYECLLDAIGDRRLRERDEPPQFAFAGRLVPSKGIEHLLEAFVQRPAYRLDIAGDGPLRAVLEKRHAEQSHIRFLGACSGAELEKLFCRARAGIVPSWGPEAGPLSLLEALACGAPAIVRRSGGGAEAVELTRRRPRVRPRRGTTSAGRSAGRRRHAVPQVV